MRKSIMVFALFAVPVVALVMATAPPVFAASGSANVMTSSSTSENVAFASNDAVSLSTNLAATAAPPDNIAALKCNAKSAVVNTGPEHGFAGIDAVASSPPAFVDVGASTENGILTMTVMKNDDLALEGVRVENKMLSMNENLTGLSSAEIADVVGNVVAMNSTDGANRIRTLAGETQNGVVCKTVETEPYFDTGPASINNVAGFVQENANSIAGGGHFKVGSAGIAPGATLLVS